MKTIIKKNNTGIEKLSNIYNKKFKYSAKHKVYDTDSEVIIEEFDEIHIETDISNKEELEEFIKEIRKTDIISIFKHITLHVKFNTFINCPNYTYITSRLVVTSPDRKGGYTKEEEYTVNLYN